MMRRLRSRQQKRIVRNRRKQWWRDPYLKVSFALITLMLLLALLAAVSWRADLNKEMAASLDASQSVMQDAALPSAAQDTARLMQQDANAAGQGAIRQETTLYEAALPEDTGGSVTVTAPQSGVLVAKESSEEDETGEDAGQEENAEENSVEDLQRNGRVFFVGDSRTIDMFADSDASVEGVLHDGVIVYAKHGHGYSYLEQVVSAASLTADDTLVTWMGANDDGNFSSYGALYDRVLAQGVRLVVCTVGPTQDSALMSWDAPYYTNDKMTSFNAQLTTWAVANDVQVINLYRYVYDNLQIDPADGIHYLPRPAPALWTYILEQL